MSAVRSGTLIGMGPFFDFPFSGRKRARQWPASAGAVVRPRDRGDRFRCGWRLQARAAARASSDRSFRESTMAAWARPNVIFGSKRSAGPSCPASRALTCLPAVRLALIACSAPAGPKRRRVIAAAPCRGGESGAPALLPRPSFSTTLMIFVPLLRVNRVQTCTAQE